MPYMGSPEYSHSCINRSSSFHPAQTGFLEAITWPLRILINPSSLENGSNSPSSSKFYQVITSYQYQTWFSHDSPIVFPWFSQGSVPRQPCRAIRGIRHIQEAIQEEWQRRFDRAEAGTRIYRQQNEGWSGHGIIGFILSNLQINWIWTEIYTQYL